MFDFIGNRKYFIAFSILLFVAGFVAYLLNGIELDIQFQGGTIIQIQMVDENFDADRAEEIVEETIGKKTNAQKSQTISGTSGDKIDLLVLNVANKEDTFSAEELDKVLEALRQEYNVKEGADISINSVEPFIGRAMLLRGLYAVVLASVLMVVYVGFRFRAISGLSAGVMAVVALFHDILVVFATHIVFRIPINDTFIATVLTILGYSLNDTIVIYDRIRENNRLMRKESIGEIVNKSINQSLTRTINTSVCVFLSVLVLFIFAQVNNIQSVKNFTLPLLLGVVSGCYSSIFIAGPLWVAWKEYVLKKKAAGKPAKA